MNKVNDSILHRRSPSEYIVLAETKLSSGQCDEAVKILKEAAQCHSQNVEIQCALANARLQVVESLREVSDESDSEERDVIFPQKLSNDSIVGFEFQSVENAAATTTNDDGPNEFPNDSQSGVDESSSQLADYLNTRALHLSRLVTPRIISMRVIKTYVIMLQEENSFRPLLAALVVGLACQLLWNWEKFVFITLMILSVGHFLWAHGYSSLGSRRNAFSKSMVLLIYSLPSLVDIFGQVSLCQFVSQDFDLSLLVLTTGTVTAVMAISKKSTLLATMSGRSFLKLVVQSIILLYCICVSGHRHDLSRLIGPLALSMFSTLTSQLGFMSILRQAIEKELEVLKRDVTEEFSDDALLVFAVLKLSIDYWQQPTTFGLEDVLGIVSEALKSLEHIEFLRPSIQTLRFRFTTMDVDSEIRPALERLTEEIMNFVPKPGMARAAAAVRRLPGLMTVIVLSSLGSGTAALVSLPFLMLEVKELMEFAHEEISRDQHDDGFEIMFSKTYAAIVWFNIKKILSGLQKSIQMTKTAQTAAQTILVAQALRNAAQNWAAVEANSLLKIATTVSLLSSALPEISILTQKILSLEDENSIASRVVSLFRR